MRNLTPRLAVFTACFALSLFAEPPPGDQPRMALLIANVTYHDPRQSLPPRVLVGTVHLYDVLKEGGFKIYNDEPLVNLTRGEMETAFSEFAATVPEHALVVVYYVGHGAERNKINYLIPVDASSSLSPARPSSLPARRSPARGSSWWRRGTTSPRPQGQTVDEGGLSGDVRLEVLLANLDKKNLTLIVILDTCRKTSGAGGGMAKPSKSESLPNSLIAFPTKPERSTGPDSIYTDALVRHLREPIRIEEVFLRTRNDVLRATDNKQEPTEHGGLRQIVYIVRPASELAEGELMVGEAYYVLSQGRKRRIPDTASFEPLGFNPGVAVKRSTEELSQIPDGDAYPSLVSNVLTSKACTYYLFWGMKWCAPPSPDPEQAVPFAFRKDGPIRALLPGESAAIAMGDVARLPSGVSIQFKAAVGEVGSPDVYRSSEGSLRTLSANELAALSPSLILNLPAFMRPLLQPPGRNPNRFSGSLVVADPSRHQIFFARGSSVVAWDLLGAETLGVIDLSPGVPELMVLAEKKGWLFVADSEQHVIHIIDAESYKRLDDIPQSFDTPTLIKGLVLSPDEQRLYVGNQGGETVATMGSISVFDLTRNHELVSTIGGVNCPEGMTITPDGDRIYLASQCGGGNDPVFVIDTSTEDVMAIPGFPTGRSIAVAPAWQKVYVSRTDPTQVSVIDTSQKKLLGNWPAEWHSFAVTPDGNYVLAIGGLHMVVIDAKTDQVISEMQFETPPAGVTVAPSNDGKDFMCYVWLPKTPRLFFSGLSELMKSPSR